MNAPIRDLRDSEVTFQSGTSTLVGRVFRPAETAKAVIVIHGATAVPQGFYRGFAEWLTSEGYGVFTYDYRDFGRSADGHPKRSKATILDWTLRDQAAAQAEAERQFDGTPVWVLGHSLGGLFLPWHENAGRIARIITVASGLVHVSHHPWRYRPAALAFWYGPGAVLTALLGYTPGKLLGMGSDFPKGVYWQWRMFCTKRDFLLKRGARQLHEPVAISAPMKLVAVADDVMVPPKSVWKLMRLYPDAVKRQMTLRAPDGRKIGHMGAFRRENADLWPDLIA